MAYHTRTLEDTLRKAARVFPSILVTGPRQSGKTTLLRKTFCRTHRFVSLENTDIRSRALADPVGFMGDHAPPIILDEIQYAPAILSHIKTAIDENRKPGQWIMSGSQGFPVMQNVSQSLAGRVAVFSLLPFSIGEAGGLPMRWRSPGEAIRFVFGGQHARGGGSIRPGTRGLDSWLLRGGYPEPVLQSRMPISQWCAGYVQTYLERDVRSLLAVGDLNAFDRFVQLCAARTAQVLNLSKLARDAGVSVPTAKRWLSVLEASYIVFLVQPYFRNIGKRLIKAPKMYFMDTALVAYLTGYRTAATLRLGPMRGPLFETAVASAWFKVFAHCGEKPSLYYWRTWDGYEIDLLIEWDGELYPVEIKATSSPRPEHGNALRWWGKHMGPGPAVVFADVEESTSLGDGIRAVPWYSI